MEEKKSSRFGLGLILGTISGALAGLFLAPKSGKKLRKEATETYEQLRKLFEEREPEEVVQEIYGKVSEKSKKHFKKTRRILLLKLADLRVGVAAIDRKRYLKVVREVVDEARREQALPEDGLKKLGKYLEDDYKKLTSAKAKNKPAKKKTSKKS